MPYINPQDAALARAAAARKEQNAFSAARRAEVAERSQAGDRMFGDDRRDALDLLVKRDLGITQGYVHPTELKEAQDAAWAALQPIINEIPGQPLSVAAVEAIVAGTRRGPISDARVDQLIDMMVSSRTAIYETRSSKAAQLTDMNAQIAEKRPLLNALLKATGAGNSVAMARELLAQSAARPLAGLLKAAKR